MSGNSSRPYGIRAISRIHHEQPYILRANGMEYRVDYEPANPPPDSSAAIPIGAGRSGSR